MTLVEAALDRIVSGERADRVLRQTLRAHPELTSEERRQVALWTLGLSLWRGRIDRLAGGERALWLPLFLVDRHGWSVEDAAALCGVAPDRLRVDATPPDDPIDRLAFERSLPVWLARRWAEDFGLERADRLAAAMNEPGPICVRANLLLNDRDALRERLLREGVRSTPSQLAPHGLKLEGRPPIERLEAWRQGRFEVQDEASQLVVEAVQASPGETIVDLCAGRGGKTLALAAAMKDEGRLVAVDVDAARLADLKGRVRRLGLSCVEVVPADATRLGPMQADAVLVDAPCSELGVLRRSPDARWRMQPDELAAWPERQWALLEAGARMVRPGGRLVYATCSIDPRENEQVAGRLAGAFSSRTLAPDVEGCDGFFVATWSPWPE